ncbi:MAG: 3-dehydroquinate synthase [Tannerellaceae bacterium]|nr:3-dehydroquinate synthase [Tannerellaceae bacterium]
MSKQKVVITTTIRTELETFLSELNFDKLFVLTDNNTLYNCYPVIKDTPAISRGGIITILAGDDHKNVEQLCSVWRFLSDNGASRNSLLVNLGGGMITDLGGFAGATFKRGIKTVNIPTTLMASVDAAVGGKTGVNFNGLKNEIGSFYPPVCVFIDCCFLNTLDRDNLLSGYAEMVKHALISTEDHYQAIISLDMDSSFPALTSYLSPLISDSVAIKKRIVEEDPGELGIRKALNFGHTIGHAIESLSFKKNRPLLHGHAVAVGLICELYLSYKQCGFPSGKLSQTIHHIKGQYKPFFFDCKDYDTLYELMAHDKKNENGLINFTLLSNIGEVQINQTATKEQVLESLDFYRETFGI